MTTFIKTYTRDNGLIIQEVWDKHYTHDYYGNTNPHSPPQVNYINDGAVEIWENREGIRWFVDQLLKKNQSDPSFLKGLIKEHLATAEELQMLAEKSHLDSVGELKNFIKLLDKGTCTFLAFYHSAVDERTPNSIRGAALAVREKDAFYDNADRLIRGTLEYLYPHSKNRAVSIMSNEIDKPPMKKVLDERFKHCVMIVDGILEITELTTFAKRKPDFNFVFPRISDSKEIRGQVAYLGKTVTGAVRVLRRKIQVAELRDGEILVSPMTTPDFVPAMKKAAAIVTNDGGITCHAAIVSRELKKPCIIGTKIATQVFKDGDLVEVDADKGVVRILSSTHVY